MRILLKGRYARNSVRPLPSTSSTKKSGIIRKRVYNTSIESNTLPNDVSSSLIANSSSLVLSNECSKCIVINDNSMKMHLNISMNCKYCGKDIGCIYNDLEYNELIVNNLEIVIDVGSLDSKYLEKLKCINKHIVRSLNIQSLFIRLRSDHESYKLTEAYLPRIQSLLLVFGDGCLYTTTLDISLRFSTALVKSIVIWSICKRTTDRELIASRLGADEPQVVSPCSCKRFKNLDLNNIRTLVNGLAKSQNKERGSTLHSTNANTRNSDTMGANLKSRIHSSSRIKPDTNLWNIEGEHIVSIEQEYEIRVDHANLSNIEAIDLMSPKLIVFTEEGFASLIGWKGECLSVKCRWRSNSQYPTIKIPGNKVAIAPGCKYTQSTEVHITTQMYYNLMSQNHTSFYRCKIMEKSYIEGPWEIRFRVYEPSIKQSIEIEYTISKQKPSTENIVQALVDFMSRFGHYSLRNYINKDFIFALVMNKRAVYDTKLFSRGECIFMVKVDGQSVWLIDGGYLWYICKTNLELDVISFFPKNDLQEFNTRPDVTHCELLINGHLIYIDTVARSECTLGKQRPFVDPKQMLKTHRSIPPVSIRIIYDTPENAEAELCITNLPCDGIVGVYLATSMTVRKKAPTVDLLAKGDKLLCESKAYNGRAVMQKEEYMVDGYVYECTLDVTDCNVPKIIKSLFRPDKLFPNSYTVYSSVILNASGIKGVHSVIRKNITTFCFGIREKLYSIAKNARTNGKLIIDVGTGRCQSATFLLDKNITWLLCDPKLSGVHTLRRPIEHNISSEDSDTVISILRSLNRGKIEIATIKEPLSNLLKVPGVIEFITQYSIPIVCSFSASHVVSEINELNESGALVFGCCYSYDKANKDGVVIDKYGISMLIHSQDPYSGTFVFGTDNEVKESVVGRSSFPDYEIVEALEFLNDSDIVVEEVKDILSNIIVFSSHKDYINSR
ncbi:hypothetical protein HK099_004574 [Clydaea vesicula]|uniref:Uncharacterized protein n=1 Tax=Clydaea vesicula TaxID=447962 RepID=A0AAD5XZI6_9FUNG|nr:hypothetical protein HK099_004574 [Clydaea vesicula]